jgi:hypothetical protein
MRKVDKTFMLPIYYSLYHHRFDLRPILFRADLTCHQHIETTPNKNWYPTKPEEIKALIGIQIVMGVLQPPAQDMYWYKDKLFHPFIAYTLLW